MDKKFIINLQGKDFVTYEGLLNDFHENGGKSIKTEIVSTAPFIIQATVEGEKGTYQGIGDADETNVNRMIVKHRYRMAETRAIARALRWYNNIGMCSADELGGEDTRASNSAPQATQNATSVVKAKVDEGFNCKACNGKAKKKSGISPKTNKPYAGIFCNDKEGCNHIEWIDLTQETKKVNVNDVDGYDLINPQYEDDIPIEDLKF